MPTLRPTVLLATLAVATTVGLAGCSSAAEQAGSASSFAEVSGSAVPVADELTALCEQVVTQALPLDAATALAEASGYESRVISIDGQPQPATKDLNESRMNFEVEADVVVACTVG